MQVTWLSYNKTERAGLQRGFEMTVKDLARLPLRRLAKSFTVTVFTPCTNFTSVFRAKRRLTSHSASEVADQSQVSGCLVTFGRCWPSAADEERYSPKRPSSTVAVNELNTKVSAFFP